jgi:hypothetical protein
MDVVAAQAAALVRKAPLPLRGSHGWHSQIQKLLDADEVRAAKQRADRIDPVTSGTFRHRPSGPAE